ncbi:MAG TPA: hypothetical protein VLU43_02605 [Anaeromyxobacteraceae bacterium]|nr:hypothetical protein [Anaeromyxobacteraceae bacterium]
MSLDALQLADVLRSSGAELARIWRSARAEARRGVAPGLLDGVVSAFLEGVAFMLEADGEPAAAWRDAVGVVRFDARDRPRSAAEIDAEWTILGAVLDAACEALEADPGPRAQLAAAVAAGRAGVTDLVAGRGPRGVLALPVLSGMGRRVASG